MAGLKRTNVMTVAVLLALLAILSGCDRQEINRNHFSPDTPFTVQQPGAGEMKMPSFELLSAQDGTYKSSSEYAGKILLITFFASWCGACRIEIDDLKEIQTTFSNQDFSVVAVSVDQHDIGNVKKLINEAEINYPILINDGRFSKQFGGISAVPVSFLIDRSGFVTKKYLSHINSRIVAEDIERLLSATKTQAD